LSGIAFAAKALLAMLVAALTFFFVPSLHASGVEGRVGEVLNPDAPPSEWRYAPLADVDVLVMWIGSPLDNLVHSNTVCLRAAYARTDSNGRFSLSGWWPKPQWPLVTNLRPLPPAPPPGFEYPRGSDFQHALATTPFTLRVARIDSRAPPESGAAQQMSPLDLLRCPTPEQSRPVK
jgi:hypothetical protein